MTEAEQQKAIGEQVRVARTRKGITQKQLAETAGVSENTVIAIEKGRNSQELKLARVMDALHMEPASEVAERAGWPPDVHAILEIVGLSLMDMPEGERSEASRRMLRAMFREDE